MVDLQLFRQRHAKRRGHQFVLLCDVLLHDQGKTATGPLFILSLRTVTQPQVRVFEWRLLQGRCPTGGPQYIALL